MKLTIYLGVFYIFGLVIGHLVVGKPDGWIISLLAGFVAGFCAVQVGRHYEA